MTIRFRTAWLDNLALLSLLFLLTAALSAALVSPALAEPKEKLIFIFQKQKDPAQLKAEAEQVAKALSAKLNSEVKTQVPMDYSASVQALVSKKADIAYVDSMSFLLARRDGGAEVLLAERRKDPQGVLRTDYDSVFVVRKDSALASFEDIVAKRKELRLAFTSATSTSGYLIPFSRFVDAKVLSPKQDPKEAFKEVSFAGSYDQALRLVMQDRADVAAVSYYTMEGESADKYLTTEERNGLRIVARTPGVPTHMVVVRTGLRPELKIRIRQSLLELSKEQPQLLLDVYGTAEFVEVDGEAHVQATEVAAQRLGILQPSSDVIAKTEAK